MLPDSLIASHLICCEMLLQEEGSRFSIIRRIDQVGLKPKNGTHQLDKPYTVAVYCSVRFDASDTGLHSIRLDLRHPDDTVINIGDTPMDLATIHVSPKSKMRGMDINAQVAIPVAIEARYWLELLIDGQIAQRCCFDVAHLPADTHPASDGTV
jgi:hypothetical protein